uniref:DNA topoisomerase (ATP-hydrolyzing) n=1 Tax=candidate division CPR3 bacterium TaxID=2268181 RepID=A0A7C5YS90_UNCC3
MHGPFEVDVSIDELLEYIKGPDFPTGGIVYNFEDIKKMYATGQGTIITRGRANIEESKSGRYSIVISEIPYQINKAKFVEHIAHLCKLEKIKGVSDIRDESNREGIRVVVELKKGVTPKVVLNMLFKYTELQTAFHGNFVALVGKQPIVVTLKDMLELFMRFRQEVVIRRTLFELIEAKHQAHILEGLLIALDHLDEVIKIIRSSKTEEEAKNRLISSFKLTDVQAQAILDMPLKRLVSLERKKIQEDYKNLTALISKLIDRLASPQEVVSVVGEELSNLKRLFGDERRTKIVSSPVGELSEEAVIPDEDVVITVSKEGYIKRTSPSSFRVQKRGGKGTLGAALKDHDFISHIVICNSHDEILFFVNTGRVFVSKAFDIPEFSKQAKGIPIVNLLNIGEEEKVTAILSQRINGSTDRTQEGDSLNEFFLMVTENGYIKRVPSKLFKNIRQNGLIAIKLGKGDSLKWVLSSDGKGDVIVASSEGRAVRFSEKEVPVLGRAARGVRSMKLPAGVKLVGADIIRDKDDKILTVSEKGFGKFTLSSKYPIKHRGGKGLLTFRHSEKTGMLAVLRVVKKDEKELLIMSQKGHAIKTPVASVRVIGRVASGVRIIRLEGEDRVVSIACI